jgi:uncharacterized protein (TIGR02444 family)
LSLWDWALEAYARQDVAPAFLALQDDHRQNVCFLLWVMWAKPEGDALRAGIGMAREWETVVLTPLRGVRRRLPVSPLRDEVKAVELKAERSLLEALEGIAGERGGDALAALSSATAMWGAPPPPEALQRLASAVSANDRGR